MNEFIWNFREINVKTFKIMDFILTFYKNMGQGGKVKFAHLK